MHRTRTAAIAASITYVILSLAAGPARAVPILDQSSPSGGNTAIVSGGPIGTDSAQVFEVGITGVLTQIDVFIEQRSNASTGDLQFDLRTAPGGVPVASNSGLLATALIPTASVPINLEFFEISSLNVPVVAGDTLAIVLRSTADDLGYGWGGVFGDPYPQGASYFRTAQTEDNWTLSVNPDFDKGFRTFVELQDSAVIPEPNGLILLVIGLGFLHGLRRNCRVHEVRPT